MADMFFMIIVFASAAVLPRNIFPGAQRFIWLMHIFAVFGLHLLARFDLKASQSETPVAALDRRPAFFSRQDRNQAVNPCPTSRQPRGVARHLIDFEIDLVASLALAPMW
jgi:hypothetical protein